MGLPSVIEGARHTALEITWTRGDGRPQDLTGATLSGSIVTTGVPSVVTAIAGSLSVLDATSGRFRWAPALADVATPGSYLVEFKALYADTTYDYSLPAEWRVLDAWSE